MIELALAVAAVALTTWACAELLAELLRRRD